MADQSNTTEYMNMEESDAGTPVKKPKLSGKRTGYLDWDKYFMAVAFLSAQRSKDPNTQVGACIVNKEKRIVGTGYNGMPNKCNDDDMSWNRPEGDSTEQWLDSKYPYVCHAELNAVLNKNQMDIKGCVMYVSLFPCNVCAQIIVQSGISEVIYYSNMYSERKEFIASVTLFEKAKVTLREFRPENITIDFTSIETSSGDDQPHADKSQEGNSTVDGNMTSSSGSDEAKINSDSRNCDELLHPEGGALSQPQDMNPLQFKAVQH